MKKSLIALAALCAAAMAATGAAFVNLLRPVGKLIEGHMVTNGLLLTAITLTERPSDDGRNYQARHLDDAGSPAAAVFNPGFTPGYVRVENQTDRIMWEWFAGMTSGNAIKTVAAGTRTLDTANELVVAVSGTGTRPSITLAAGVTLQNKQYQVHATR